MGSVAREAGRRDRERIASRGNSPTVVRRGCIESRFVRFDVGGVLFVAVVVDPAADADAAGPGRNTRSGRDMLLRRLLLLHLTGPRTGLGLGVLGAVCPGVEVMMRTSFTLGERTEADRAWWTSGTKNCRSREDGKRRGGGGVDCFGVRRRAARATHLFLRYVHSVVVVCVLFFSSLRCWRR